MTATRERLRRRKQVASAPSMAGKSARINQYRTTAKQIKLLAPADDHLRDPNVPHPASLPHPPYNTNQNVKTSARHRDFPSNVCLHLGYYVRESSPLSEVHARPHSRRFNRPTPRGIRLDTERIVIICAPQ
eukprot:1179368-Prorocentrum_minimum.AAC.2